MLVTLGLALAMVGLWTASGAAQTEGETGTTETETTETEPAPASQAPSAEQLAAEEQLREGARAYGQVCASCHQAGGIGVVGQYPPLVDNPNVDDADYLRTVITAGRAGEILVNGVTYDGIMPSFSTLPDDDTEAIIAYIQNDFVAPAAQVAILPTGPVAGTELPALTNMGAWLTYLITAGGALLVLGPRIISENSRLRTPWLDAWLKTAVIVSAVILLVVYIPDQVVRTEAVTKLSRFSQDLIGVALWAAGLGTVLGGLWYAHRESRV